MPDQDLRSSKTEKALCSAMISLLKKHSFKKITVSNICEEAIISRATFYMHFTDKYHFLEWWIRVILPDDIVNKDDTYKVKEQKVNQFADDNKTIIKNLLADADRWTFEALYNALHFILRLNAEKEADGLVNPKYVVLSNFYISGMISYIMWQVKNDFPKNVVVMNEHLFEVIKIFQGWN